ncbi:3-deoxy-D-arabinoheptulosonate-7-phosphate synthase [Hydrocarboniphaga daqingensis]|uniref:Phospho-2-dehydro-3-deoxyheptonate aldolase n=1 Tax=Hydrocarboniphaga daqingensis TaxID=490188 RepID=A0A1M5LLT8_9GAMM|nr:3-deoxy-7-phosphoheptulonate synthase [Hydrocarboniphaga daqingensis]SHG66027.1 3-deoxy-D-arabinoheptulosonate-7-phosphate synthase [Hydrocarboniphaga daqingensis]
MKFVTDNIRLRARAVSTPAQVQNELPLNERAAQTTFDARREIQDILAGRDDRLLVVVGPCSIHDVDAALEYAQRLATARDALKQDLLIVMRVYFEKPRTTVGWKGLINDPGLDDTYDIDLGLRTARKLLLDLNGQGMPAGVEYLDLLTPQYLSDLVSWGAIGARTTESQLHREMASGLSCPVGFKNGTDGSVKVAVDACMAARSPHRFLSLTQEGQISIFETTGNEDCHIILRGGTLGTNYDTQAVEAASAAMTKAALPARIMIDFSHANSSKQHKRQIVVAQDVGAQIASGDTRIMGVMVESHLVEGRQEIAPRDRMCYGQSVTDACIGWDDTVEVLRGLAANVAQRRQQLAKTA